MAQYSHLSAPTPELLAILATTTALDLGSCTPKDMPSLREQLHTTAVPAILERYRARLPPVTCVVRSETQDSTYSVEHHKVPVDDGEIDVRVLTPASGDKTSTFPIMVWYHGGGGVLGNLDFDDFPLRMLCVEFQIVIVNVDYRLAPEHPFPIGGNDSYAALKWTAINAASLHAAPEKGFLAAGLSAGAKLGAVVVHRAASDSFFKAHKITGQLLQCPALLHPAAYPPEYAPELLSYEQNKDSPSLSKAMMDLFYECIAGPPSDPAHSPLLALADKSLSLPRTYLQICGMDPLRDEAFLYARLLRERGVSTKVDIYPGLPHGFHQSYPQLEAVKTWEADVRAGLRWLLNSGV